MGTLRRIDRRRPGLNLGEDGVREVPHVHARVHLGMGVPEIAAREVIAARHLRHIAPAQMVRRPVLVHLSEGVQGLGARAFCRISGFRCVV